MGIFSRRMNREGAIAGMVIGLGFTTAYIVYFKFMHQELNTPEHWFMGISPEGIGSIGMVINFGVAALVASFTPPPSAEVDELITSIRVPKGAGSAAEH